MFEALNRWFKKKGQDDEPPWKPVERGNCTRVKPHSGPCNGWMTVDCLYDEPRYCIRDKPHSGPCNGWLTDKCHDPIAAIEREKIAAEVQFNRLFATLPKPPISRHLRHTVGLATATFPPYRVKPPASKSYVCDAGSGFLYPSGSPDDVETVQAQPVFHGFDGGDSGGAGASDSWTAAPAATPDPSPCDSYTDTSSCDSGGSTVFD